MAQLQQEVARLMMEDPDVETLSSFVGVDAANNTMLHTGRMLINLKSGHDNQQRVIDRLRAQGAARPGHRAVPAADAGPDHRRRIAGPRSTACRSKARTTPRWWNGPAKLVQQLRTVSELRNVVTDADASGRRAVTSTSIATRPRG